MVDIEKMTDHETRISLIEQGMKDTRQDLVDIKRAVVGDNDKMGLRTRMDRLEYKTCVIMSLASFVGGVFGYILRGFIGG